MALRPSPARVLVAALLLAGLASPASAALTRDQRACVDGLTKALDQVDRQVARQIGVCLKRHAKGKPYDKQDPSIQTLEACAAADLGDKIASAGLRTEAQFEKLCTPPPAGQLEDPFPPFGATDAARVNGAGLGLPTDLAHDLFGPDLDAALSTERDAAKCQQAVWKAAAGCHQVRSAAFRRCQKGVLVGDGTRSAESRAELREGCLGSGVEAQPDPRGRVAAACSDPGKGIAKALAKSCGGQDLDALLPGCAGEPDTAACLERRAACRSCEELSGAGDLRRSCDLFDDGEANGSCGESTAIRCQNPADGDMLAAAPGSMLDFAGQVQDASQLEDVTVDGVPVALDAEGFFSHPVTLGSGVHFVEVAGTDELGAERRRICSFLASETFLAEDDFLDDALALRLAQAALDDGGRVGELNSLGDVLHAVMNHPNLRNALHLQLLAENPLKPMSCDQEVCVLGACVCVLSSEVSYVSPSLVLNGPNSAELELVDGGLGSEGTAQNLGVTIRVRGTAAGIGFDENASLHADLLRAGLISDLELSDGAFHSEMRTMPPSLEVEIQGLTGSLPVVPNFVTNFVLGLLTSTFEDLLGGFVPTSFDFVLEALLGGAALPSAGLDVPRIGEPGVVALELEGAPSSISATTSRGLIGLGTRITAPAAHALPSLGVALFGGADLGDPGAGMPLAYAGHVGVVNQLLHALWRGGLLHGHLDASVAPDLPADVEADVEALLPPLVTAGDGDRWRVQLGALRIQLSYPDLFDGPVLLSAGAEASATLVLDGDTLVLEDVALDAVHVTAVDAALDPLEQTLVDLAARALLHRLLDAALGAAAQGLPVPALEIPATLGIFGLPVGGKLGMVDPTLDSTPTHVLLTGELGIR